MSAKPTGDKPAVVRGNIQYTVRRSGGAPGSGGTQASGNPSTASGGSRSAKEARGDRALTRLERQEEAAKKGSLTKGHSQSWALAMQGSASAAAGGTQGARGVLGLEEYGLSSDDEAQETEAAGKGKASRKVVGEDARANVERSGRPGSERGAGEGRSGAAVLHGGDVYADAALTGAGGDGSAMARAGLPAGGQDAGAGKGRRVSWSIPAGGTAAGEPSSVGGGTAQATAGGVPSDGGATTAGQGKGVTSADHANLAADAGHPTSAEPSMPRSAHATNPGAEVTGEPKSADVFPKAAVPFVVVAQGEGAGHGSAPPISPSQPATDAAPTSDPSPRLPRESPPPSLLREAPPLGGLEHRGEERAAVEGAAQQPKEREDLEALGGEEEEDEGDTESESAVEEGGQGPMPSSGRGGLAQAPVAEGMAMADQGSVSGLAGSLGTLFSQAAAESTHQAVAFLLRHVIHVAETNVALELAGLTSALKDKGMEEEGVAQALARAKELVEELDKRLQAGGQDVAWYMAGANDADIEEEAMEADRGGADYTSAGAQDEGAKELEDAFQKITRALMDAVEGKELTWEERTRDIREAGDVIRKATGVPAAGVLDPSFDLAVEMQCGTQHEGSVESNRRCVAMVTGLMKLRTAKTDRRTVAGVRLHDVETVGGVEVWRRQHGEYSVHYARIPYAVRYQPPSRKSTPMADLVAAQEHLLPLFHEVASVGKQPRILPVRVRNAVVGSVLDCIWEHREDIAAAQSMQRLEGTAVAAGRAAGWGGSASPVVELASTVKGGAAAAAAFQYKSTVAEFLSDTLVRCLTPEDKRKIGLVEGRFVPGIVERGPVIAPFNPKAIDPLGASEDWEAPEEARARVASRGIRIWEQGAEMRDLLQGAPACGLVPVMISVSEAKVLERDGEAATIWESRATSAQDVTERITERLVLHEQVSKSTLDRWEKLAPFWASCLVMQVGAGAQDIAYPYGVRLLWTKLGARLQVMGRLCFPLGTTADSRLQYVYFGDRPSDMYGFRISGRIPKGGEDAAVGWTTERFPITDLELSTPVRGMGFLIGATKGEGGWGVRMLPLGLFAAWFYATRGSYPGGAYTPEQSRSAAHLVTRFPEAVMPEHLVPFSHPRSMAISWLPDMDADRELVEGQDVDTLLGRRAGGFPPGLQLQEGWEKQQQAVVRKAEAEPAAEEEGGGAATGKGKGKRAASPAARSSPVKQGKAGEGTEAGVGKKISKAATTPSMKPQQPEKRGRAAAESDGEGGEPAKKARKDNAAGGQLRGATGGAPGDGGNRGGGGKAGNARVRGSATAGTGAAGASGAGPSAQKGQATAGKGGGASGSDGGTDVEEGDSRGAAPGDEAKRAREKEARRRLGDGGVEPPLPPLPLDAEAKNFAFVLDPPQGVKPGKPEVAVLGNAATGPLWDYHRFGGNSEACKQLNTYFKLALNATIFKEKTGEVAWFLAPRPFRCGTEQVYAIGVSKYGDKRLLYRVALMGCAGEQEGEEETFGVFGANEVITYIEKHNNNKNSDEVAGTLRADDVSDGGHFHEAKDPTKPHVNFYWLPSINERCFGQQKAPPKPPAKRTTAKGTIFPAWALWQVMFNREAVKKNVVKVERHDKLVPFPVDQLEVLRTPEIIRGQAVPERKPKQPKADRGDTDSSDEEWAPDSNWNEACPGMKNIIKPEAVVIE